MTKTTITYIPDADTISAAYQAISCQDACNATGVLHALSRHFTNMRANSKWKYNNTGTPYRLDTDTCNQHPVMIMFLDKLCQLARYNNQGHFSLFSKAHDACTLLMNNQPADWDIVRYDAPEQSAPEVSPVSDGVGQHDEESE